MLILIVGIFSPVINWCGGAEWVAINLIDALKERGHQVIILTDKPLDQDKFVNIFGKKVSVDRQIVFPFRFFSATDGHNLYTDIIRALILKAKCHVLVDTFSNAILPSMDVCYIHYPLLKSVEKGLPRTRNLIYFYPYKNFLNFNKNSYSNKLIFANSKFTAAAIEAEFGICPNLLYPSVSNKILNHKDVDFDQQRQNHVITISRINAGKDLQIIPHIARLVSTDISFTIAGLLDSPELLFYLRKMINRLQLEKRVRILTNISRENLRKILLESKVYLHTKKDEHFGISIVEAMSSGCIPVVHDSGGPREFVSAKFRFKDIEDAAEKVEKAVKYWSSEKAKKISRDADKFGEDKFSKQFMDVFDMHFKGRT